MSDQRLSVRPFFRRRFLLPALLLLCTVLLLYLPVIHHQFLTSWDDGAYITDNTHVRSGFTHQSVKWALTTSEMFYWQPISWLSHITAYQLFAMNSGGHLYLNVLLHGANSLLLFALLFQGTGALWRSFVVAGLFALHPTNVQTVAWVAERNNLLMALFALLTVAAHGWYVRHANWKRYFAVLAAFVAALMCKPYAVVVPVILLLVDFWPLQRLRESPPARRFGRLVLEKLPLLLISLALTIQTYLSGSSHSVISFSALPLSTRIESSVICYVGYLAKIIWPQNLSPFYTHLAMFYGPSLPMDLVLGSALVLLVITAVALYFYKTGFAPVGWLFYLLTLLPVIGLVQTGYAGRSDHYTYLPAIGIFIMAAWGVAALCEKASVPRAVPVAAGLCLVAGYAATTFHYLQYWQNNETVFERALAVESRPNPWLESLYADALLKDGRPDDALQHYQRSCAITPRNEYCHFGIAEILFQRGQYADAVDQYRVAFTLTGHREMALACLNKAAQALLKLGNYTAAEGAISRALEIDPANPTALSLRSALFTHR